MNYDYIQPQAGDAHLGFDPLLLQVTIMQVQHLMKKLAKWSQIDKFTHFQQCLPHPLKRMVGKKYLHDEPLAVIKNGAKSLDNKVDNFLTPVQLYGN